MRKRLATLAGMSVLVVGLLQASGAGATDIVAAMNTSRLTSLSKSGGVVTAEGQADEQTPGDDTRTDWYELIGAVAFVQENGGSFVERKVYDGTTFLYSDKDESASLTVDPDDVITESEAESQAAKNASAVGGTVVELNHLPFFGGSIELVFQPTDSEGFLGNYEENLTALVDGLIGPTRPTLVSIVDSNEDALVVVGYVPLGDPTETSAGGISVGWQARARGVTVLGGGTAERANS
jgi:hypothetical protein